MLNHGHSRLVRPFIMQQPGLTIATLAVALQQEVMNYSEFGITFLAAAERIAALHIAMS